MHWTEVTLRDLEVAMRESKRLGLDAMRTKYGFSPANNVHMYLDSSGPFEARVLLAAAYAHKFNHRIGPKAFESTNAHVFLEKCFRFRQERFKTRNQRQLLRRAA